MAEKWIAVKGLTRNNNKFDFEDLASDFKDIPELKLVCNLVENDYIKAKVELNNNETGLVIRGKLEAQVHSICSKCAEDCLVKIANDIDEFEFYPDSVLEQDKEDKFDKSVEVDTLIFRKDKFDNLEINILGFLWEIFVIAMPVKTLCKDDCNGLCITCGQNLNLGTCSCKHEELDPRLAKLQNIKIKPKL